MSLAMYAAPFNENFNNNNEENDNLISKKRQTHNKTQKKYPKENFDTQKVNSVLENIHNNSKADDDETDGLSDFNPPPKPESAGVTRTKDTTEHMSNMSNESSQVMFRTLGRSPQPNYQTNEDLELNNYTTNYGDNNSVEQYYKKILPGYKHVANTNPVNKLYYNASASVSQMNDSQSQDVLLNKWFCILF